MREQLKVSARQASAEVELAASLAEGFPATLAALQAGEITLGHARVISRVGADAEHENEPALLEMARGVPVDLFARMTRHHYRPEQETLREHRRQHDNRWASLVQDPDGSWRLTAYFGHDTGKRVSSFESMARTYRNGEDRTGALTARQRRADALANLITAEGPHRRGSVTLMVIADHDAVRRESRLPLRRRPARTPATTRRTSGASQDPARLLRHRRRSLVARPSPKARQRRPAGGARGTRRRLRQLRRTR